MNSNTADQLNLVADIGGTNTRVALAQGGDLMHDTALKFSNSEHPDLGSVLENYLKRRDIGGCAGACVAVAGPVRDGVGHLTNLNWSINRELLTCATKTDNVAILNDLQAQGHSISLLPQTSIISIIPPRTNAPNTAKLVVGLGTGFNAAVVYDTPTIKLVPPSECGHGDLPVQTTQDFSFAEYIRGEFGFCAPDEVLSGRGLERLYSWHGVQMGISGQRKANQILESLANASDPVAESCARHFVHLAAVTFGNLALTYLPYGGIYLAGGVARAFAPHFSALGFEQSFTAKGRFSDFMGNFAVSVIEDDNAALSGCASFLANRT